MEQIKESIISCVYILGEYGLIDEEKKKELKERIYQDDKTAFAEVSEILKGLSAR